MPDPLAPLEVKIPVWWPVLRGALLLLGVWLVAFPLLLLRPAVSYRVAGGQITAHSVAAKVVIPAGTPVKTESLNPQRRVFGSAMPGYVVGIFDLPGQGRAKLFTDGSSPALVFDTPGTATMLTPANPEALLETWRGGGSATFYPATHPKPWLLLFMGLFTAGLFIALFARQNRISYEWTPEALITRSVGHTHRFPYRDTAAQITHEPLGVRLLGTATPGYFTGTFSTRSLGNVQAIATSGRPQAALLLKESGRTYYLTPNDPQAALARFKGRISS